MAKYILAEPEQYERMADWLQAKIPGFEYGKSPYTCMGLTHSMGGLIAVTLFENFTHTDVHLHAACESPKSLTREYLGEVFRYVFHQLGCVRCTALVPSNNHAAKTWNEKVGFTLEGRARKMLKTGEDLIIYGMLREECRWLKVGVNAHGNKHSTTEYRRAGYAKADASPTRPAARTL